MIARALRRAGTSWKIFFIAAALFCVGIAGTTTALFSANVTNKTSTFGGGWVGSPTSAAVAGPHGADMTVTWATPTTTGVQGYAIVWTNMGTTAAACPTTPITGTTTVQLVAPASSYVADNATTTSDSGYYFCYQVRSYWTTNSWYGTNPSQPANASRVGLWASAASITNGDHTRGNITSKDSISLTFNQAVSSGNVTIASCTTAKTVLIGAATCSSTPTIGTLTTSGSIGTATTWTGTVSGSGTATLTIALAGNSSSTDSGTFTFTPSGSLSSAVGSPAPGSQAVGCNAAHCAISAGGPF